MSIIATMRNETDKGLLDPMLMDKFLEIIEMKLEVLAIQKN